MNINSGSPPLGAKVQRKLKPEIIVILRFKGIIYRTSKIKT